MKLVPLVELQPGAFQRDWRDPRPDPAQWEAYWRASLAESGIEGLALSPAGYACVEASALLRPDVLAIVIAAHDDAFAALRGPPTHVEALDPDDIGAFAGGYALYLGDELFIEPGCCVSLGDIRDWETLARHRGDELRAVWCGDEVALAGRYVAEDRELELLRARTLSRHPEVERRERVAPRVLSAAVEEEARDVLERLAQTSTEVLSVAFAPSVARELGRRIAGLEV